MTSDAERAKRIRELAREAETSSDPKEFERVLGKVVSSSENSDKSKRPDQKSD
jgi:hypothetical protein